MQRDDDVDFIAHPEWFTVAPLSSGRVVEAVMGQVRKLSQTEQMYVVERLVNPPVVISRKPIPFVLPIRGSAL